MRCSRRWPPLLIGVMILGLGMQAASATTLGGVTSVALTSTTNTTIALRAFDLFTGTTGVAIAGTSTDAPAGIYTWSEVAGTWKYSTNRAACTVSIASGQARISVPSITEVSVEAIFTRTGNAYNMGVLVNGNGTNSFVARWRTNSATLSTIELGTWVGTTFTVLATTTIARPAAATIRLESYGDTTNANMNVYANGVLVLTHTLSAGNAALAHGASATQVGMTCNTDKTSFADFFHVDV